MKALMLRIGIDSVYGALSPVFEDNTFEYIPIYYRNIKENEYGEKRCFNDIIGSTGKPLSDYLKEKLRNKLIHYDPEFVTYTYGEVGKSKRKAILSLESGDYLIFYMGGYYINNPQEKHCFIIGYFEVEKVYDWLYHSKEMVETCYNNAHIISSKSKKNLVIVKGTQQSKLFKKCILLTEKCNKKGIQYVTNDEFRNLYGIREYITRAVPIWIRDKYFYNIKNLLVTYN